MHILLTIFTQLFIPKIKITKNMKTTKLLLLMSMFLMGTIGAQAQERVHNYVELSTDKQTLTFYRDAQERDKEGTTYHLNTDENAPLWQEDAKGVKTVVFDTSFRDARPTSCYKWFADMSELTTIEMKNPSASSPTDINYMNLNTSDVTTMKEMFRGCSSLETLPHLYRLNTSNVTDMSGMFYNCSSLTSLDLADHSFMSETEGRIRVQSQFSTANVTTMASMFSGCHSLTSLNVTKFNTSSVTNMRAMFQNCSSLSILRLSNFNTSLVENMAFMFNHCDNLNTIVGLENFDTSQVTSMQQMFAFCKSLKQLNLPFNTSSVEQMYYIFAECSSLVSADISSFVFPDGDATFGLFMDCYAMSQLTVSATASNLMLSDNSGALAGVGTKLSPCHLICLDEFTPVPEEESNGWFKWKGGYFSSSAVSAYAALKDTILTFRYDDQKVALALDGADVYGLNEGDEAPAWQNNVISVINLTKVVFDASFAEVRPASCCTWFSQMNELKTIEGMEYLNTSEVTNMAQMFLHCHILKHVDVSHFNTSKVENMNYMFNNCWNLFTLDISNFDLPAENTYQMFVESSINHLSIPACAAVLQEDACEGMGHVDYPWNLICPVGFIPEPQETDPDGRWIKWKGGYFTISQTEPYAALKNNVLTFRYDNKMNILASGGAIIYDLNEGINVPGWAQNPSVTAGVTNVVIDSLFANVKPVSCAYWFNQMYDLESIEGMEYLNTSEVTNMHQMFCNCRNLTQVDVSHFNTSKVEDMSYMFYNCWNLFTLDISNFVLPAEFTYGMFYNASINDLAVPVGAEVIQAGACGGMGSQENPYRLICPAGFEPQPDVEDGVEIVDPNGKWIQWKGGYFIVCPMGDANGDGRVTVADVMLAVNKVLGKPVSNFIMLASDMNKDGMITVADIMQIVKTILVK